MDNNLEIVASMRDNASPQLNKLQQTLIANKSAISELAGGTQQLGTTFLALAVGLKASNNEMAQQLGNTFAMVGGLITAIGGTVRFISAISQMTSALKALNIQQIIANALAGPAGWVKLGIGAAVAGGAVYAMTRASGGGGGSSSKATTNVTVNQHIAGSVVTERQLVDNVQAGLLKKGQRSYSTGIK